MCVCVCVCVRASKTVLINPISVLLCGWIFVRGGVDDEVMLNVLRCRLTY